MKRGEESTRPLFQTVSADFKALDSKKVKVSEVLQVLFQFEDLL